MFEISMWDLLIFGTLQAIIIAFLAKKFFKNVQMVGPLLLWKSKKGLKWIDRISKKHQWLWKAYGDFGIILAFGFIGAWYVFKKHKTPKRLLLSLITPLFLLSSYIAEIISVLFLGQKTTVLNTLLFGDGLTNLVSIVLLYFGGYAFSLVFLLSSEAFNVITGYISSTPVTAAVAPALPGIDVKGSPFKIPWYGWLVFPILLFVHEVSHGILARVGKFKLKSTGIVLFGLFPFGAFVEPDEKQLSKGPVRKQLRVYSVGSSANYLLSFLMLSILVLGVYPAIEASGFVDGLNQYYDHPQIDSMLPSSEFELEQGMKIISINGTTTNSIDEVHSATQSLGPNAGAEIVTTNGTFYGKLNENAQIGIAALSDTFKKIPFEIEFFFGFLSFLTLIVFFNFVVGIMNLLPMFPLDGGQMLQALLGTKMKKKQAMKYAKLVTYFVLALFLINILPLLFPNS